MTETCPYCGSESIQASKVRFIQKKGFVTTEAVEMECRNMSCLRKWTPREKVLFT